MAEIKSTLEIAMEKASRLDMDEGEERELRVKTQVEAVLRDLKLRPSGEPDTKRIREALARVPDDLAAEVEREVLKNLFQRLELSGEDLGVVALAREVAGDEKQDDLEDLAREVKRALEKKEELEGRDAGEVSEKLESKGVGGSAVVTPEEARPEQREELDSLYRKLKSKAEDIAEG